MRTRDSNAGLTVLASAGTFVALLGMDLDKNLAEQCLGFSIERTNHPNGDVYFMSKLERIYDASA